MEQITGNLGAVRREKVNGRDFVVAPLTLIVPGVLAGSKGALLYEPNEIGRDPSIWAGVPLTRNHPTENGSPVSARTPGVLARDEIGRVYNPRIEDGKLRADGWFDVESVRRVEPRILQALDAGRTLELSTGLFLDQIPAQPGAAYNGREYTATAKNFRADHVAVLIDQQGACSVADGCGVNNAERSNDAGEATMFRRFLDWFTGPASNPTENPDATPVRPEWVQDEAIWNQAKAAVGPGKGGAHWAAVARTYRELGGEVGPAPITAEVVTVNHQSESTMPLSKEQRSVLVGEIVANCDCFKTAADREVLTNLSDDALSAMHAQRKAPVTTPTTPVVNTATPPVVEPPVAHPVTVTNRLTPEEQATLAWAQAEMGRQRGELVGRLTANVADAAVRAATAAVYGALPLEQLRTLAQALPAAAPQHTAPPMYVGPGLYTPPAVNAEQDAADVRDMTPPTINWSEWAKRA